jgi:hypothetical protein
VLPNASNIVDFALKSFKAATAASLFIDVQPEVPA